MYPSQTQSVQVAKVVLETQRLFGAPQDCMDASEEYARKVGNVSAGMNLLEASGWGGDVVTFRFEGIAGRKD